MTPRLLFGPADLSRIRATLTRREFEPFRQFIGTGSLEADRNFLLEQLSLRNLIADALRAQSILLRCAFLHASAEQPDPRQLDLARLALQRLLAYPRCDWIIQDGQHTVAVMRGAGFCVSLALAADWLGDALSAEEHAAIDRFMATEGGPACHRAVFGMTHHDRAGLWTMDRTNEGLTFVDVTRWPQILDGTNLRIIATSGLAAAACHLHGRHPDSATWLALARDSLRCYAGRLPADGSCDEGISYWDFTFTYYILSIELLRRRIGIDERALVNFPAQARYALAAAMPTAGHPDDCINIGDANVAASAVPLAWIAREFREPAAQFLTTQPAAVRPGWLGALAAIWFDPTLPASLPADVPLDRVCDPEIVVSRSGWGLADDVVALRSGGPRNHEHADRNSVLFKSHGERLLNDPLRASYSPRHPKWLLRLTEAHTSVLIDGHGHAYHHGEEGTNASTAAATLQTHRIGPGWSCATSDATDAYARAGLPVQLVQRTILHLKPGVLVIADRVLLSAPLPVQLRFQAFNDDGAARVTAAEDTFLIARPHATLQARVHSTAAFTIASAQLPLPEAEGIYPFAEVVSPSALSHTLLTVCTTAPTGVAHGTITARTEGDRWSLAGEHRGLTVAATFVFSGREPPSVQLG